MTRCLGSYFGPTSPGAYLVSISMMVCDHIRQDPVLVSTTSAIGGSMGHKFTGDINSKSTTHTNKQSYYHNIQSIYNTKKYHIIIHIDS